MSALSIDRLLNDARQLTTTATIEDRVATDDGVHAPESQAAEETDAPSVAVQIPPVHGEAVRTFAQNPRLLLPASGRASGIHGSRHEQTAPQRRRVLYDAPPARQAHVLETVARPFDLHSHHLHAAEDEEMLDYGPDSSLATTPQEPVYASLQQAEALAFAPGSSTLDRDSWAAPSPQVDLGAGSYREPLELTPNNTLLSRSVSVGRTRQGDHPAAPASGDGLHGLSGFWRPNMLY